jgi:predicted PurR-regulated permease PerM
MSESGRFNQNLGWIVFGAAFFILYQLRIALIPFFIALTFAYLTLPLVDRLEKRMPRVWAALIVFLIFLFGGAYLLFLLGSLLVDQIQNLYETLTRFFEQQDWSKYMPSFKKGLPVDWKGLLSSLSSFLSKGLKAAESAAFLVLSVIVIPVYSFFLLRDGHQLAIDLKQMLPSQNKAEILSFLSEVNAILRNFIQGQLLIAGLNSLMAIIGLSIVGVRYSLLLGTLWGAGTLVPFVGHSIGVVVSLIMAWVTFQKPSALLAVTVVFFVVNLLENYIWQPRIMGRRLKVHPLLVILSIVVWGVVLGFLGVLLAVPITASLEVLYRRLVTPKQPLPNDR